ncbi:LysM peptidoglycan-binding domain-containing protein [Allosalinactinospora lopnorensis]|uniref:LysM peptidoglycan-binding domain-containing protein n=1 Tax=Allosalinactinospora lopnorensis TaxID=1352348 RepID=UPI000623F02D|nr:LysM peptidoglycan-binding domain-containing protein [Allosalinactinospora lopnorensis]
MSEPVLQRPTRPAAPREAASRVLCQGGGGEAESVRPASAPALYDWAEEIPEWRSERAVRERRPPAPALADLPSLHAARPGAPGVGPAPGGTKLTRRGRVVSVAALTAVATSVLSVLFLTAATADSPSGSPADSTSSLLGVTPDTVIVEDGDTLWEIAEQARPAEDPRRTVHEIVELNDLPAADLAPGQELLLPAS